MIDTILNLLFRCSHQRMTRPMTPASKAGDRRGETYIVCLECGKQFSVTEGTIFNDTHLSLDKWFMATALMVNAKKGLSALQLKRDIGCAYKTAWYLNHRIRKAMGLADAADAELVVFSSDIGKPNTSSISFAAGRTRANNAVFSLSNTSTTFSVFNKSAAALDFVLDVNGYFQ